jgi:hypothetical protein
VADIDAANALKKVTAQSIADLAAGGALFADPGADRIAFWDDSASAFAPLSLNANLAITGTELDLGATLSGISTIASVTLTGSNLTHSGNSFPTTVPNIADPNADRIYFWDDSAGAPAFLTAGTGLSITGTTLAVTSASGAVEVINTRTTSVNCTATGSLEQLGTFSMTAGQMATNGDAIRITAYGTNTTGMDGPVGLYLGGQALTSVYINSGGGVGQWELHATVSRKDGTNQSWTGRSAKSNDDGSNTASGRLHGGLLTLTLANAQDISVGVDQSGAGTADVLTVEQILVEYLPA